MISTNPQDTVRPQDAMHLQDARRPQGVRSATARKERASEIRSRGPERSPLQQQKQQFYEHPPAAGAHAARHLVNEDATPGAGVLPSYAHRSGREVDGGAG